MERRALSQGFLDDNRGGWRARIVQHKVPTGHRLQIIRETPLRLDFLFRPQCAPNQLTSCFVDTLHNGENESCRRSSHLGYFENEHGSDGTVLSTRKLSNKHLLGKATAR